MRLIKLRRLIADVVGRFYYVSAFQRHLDAQMVFRGTADLNELRHDNHVEPYLNKDLLKYLQHGALRLS